MTATVLNRSPSNGTSVLISGSGVGGLVAALELWRQGCDVRIFERTKASLTAGDTFMVGPSALRMLKNWPEMDARHQKIAYEPLYVRADHTGKWMGTPVEYAIKANTTGRNSKFVQHSRPKFHAMLLEQIERCGLQIEFDKEVIDYFENESAGKGGLVLNDGSRNEAYLVIAADGLRGKSWSLIAGKPVPAKSSGTAVFRAAYPIELALKDPVIAERFKLHESGRTILELWTGEKMFGTFWRTDESMMWSITHPDNGTGEESWSNRITPDAVLAFTATIPHWPEVADRVIKATPGSLVDWKLMWRDPQPKWTSTGGHVVQVGDAAHTFLPSSGNGAVQAIEDAVALAACVAKAGKGKIPNATRVHNLLRFERVSFLQAMGAARQGERIRKAGVHTEGSKRKAAPMPGKWLYEHHPEQYVRDNFQQALLSLKSGDESSFQNTNRPSGVEYRAWTIDSLAEALDNGEPTILDGDWS